MEAKSLSLTQYYSLFANSLSSLNKITQSSSFEKAYQAAQEICQQGLLLEQQSNPLTMQKIVGEIVKITNRLGPECDVALLENNNKVRQYPLPQIDDLPQLLFSIVYLKHLLNYETVEYAGDITTYWGVDALSKINDTVESKKSWIVAIAKVLEINIKIYCQNNEINFDEAIYQNLSKPNFITIISKKLNPTNQSTNEFSIEELKLEKTNILEQYMGAANNFEEYNKILLELSKVEKQLLAQTPVAQTFFSDFSNWLLPSELFVRQQQLVKKLESITPKGILFSDHLKELKDVKQLASKQYNRIVYKYFSLKSQLNTNKQGSEELGSEVLQDINNENKLNIKTSVKALTKNEGFFKLEMPSTKNLAIGGAVAAASLIASYYAM